VAILGGITSAWGVMIAGLLFGMAEALITATLGSGTRRSSPSRW
jgi:branched-chain amino acid transport system permease protein